MDAKTKYKVIKGSGAWKTGKDVLLTEKQAMFFAKRGVVSLTADSIDSKCITDGNSIEDVRAEYLEAIGNEVSNRYKNNAEWMNKKIEEAK